MLSVLDNLTDICDKCFSVLVMFASDEVQSVALYFTCITQSKANFYSSDTYNTKVCVLFVLIVCTIFILLLCLILIKYWRIET